MEYKSTGRRVGATLIDYTLVYALTYYYISIAGKSEYTDNSIHTTVSGLPALVPEMFWFVYFVITERYMGGTLGHHIFKLKVIPMAGQELTFSQVLVRRIFDVVEISWCFGFVAFLVTQSNPYHQRIGDLVAKTRVIGPGDVEQEPVFDFEQK